MRKVGIKIPLNGYGLNELYTYSSMIEVVQFKPPASWDSTEQDVERFSTLAAERFKGLEFHLTMVPDKSTLNLSDGSDEDNFKSINRAMIAVSILNPLSITFSLGYLEPKDIDKGRQRFARMLGYISDRMSDIPLKSDLLMRNASVRHFLSSEALLLRDLSKTYKTTPYAGLDGIKQALNDFSTYDVGLCFSFADAVADSLFFCREFKPSPENHVDYCKDMIDSLRPHIKMFYFSDGTTHGRSALIPWDESLNLGRDKKDTFNLDSLKELMAPDVPVILSTHVCPNLTANEIVYLKK